jgi:hypothetical protein
VDNSSKSFKFGKIAGNVLAILIKVAIYWSVFYYSVDYVFKVHKFPFAPLTFLLAFWCWQKISVIVGYLNALHSFHIFPQPLNEPTGIGPDGEWTFE